MSAAQSNAASHVDQKPPFEVDILALGAAGPDHVELLPASYRDDEDNIHSPLANSEFLENELTLKKLNMLHKLFWVVGRPMPPRPLNYQRTLSRDIFITEKMNMHLVWTSGRIYLKPIPRFLLSSAFWEAHLKCKAGNNVPCRTQDTTRSDQKELEDSFCNTCRFRRISLGFLLSYTALIQHESDYEIAKQSQLIPRTIEWQDWKTFVKQILQVERIYQHINPRFVHGELRLSRLNKLYRFYLLKPFRGYAAGYNRYGDFLYDNFAALASVTVYIALVLTAMQVGLATNELQGDSAFSAASYGFTIFAIVAPIGITMGILIVVFIWAFVNISDTLKYKKKRMADLGLVDVDVKKGTASTMA